MGTAYYKSGDAFISKVETCHIVANIKNDEYYLYNDDKSTFFNMLSNMLELEQGANVRIPWDQVRPEDPNFQEEIINNSLLKIKHGMIICEKGTISDPEGSVLLPWPGLNSKRSAKYTFVFFISFVIGSLVHKLLPAILTIKISLFIKRNVNMRKITQAQLEKIAESFIEARKYLYTSRDQCYYESLILYIYLSLLGLKPNWVFAVNINPFKAHCWIEVNGLLFNDMPGTAMSYHPIFKI